jgi:hypothetical protein
VRRADPPISCAATSRWIKGSANAAVLPVPVAACPRMSRPSTSGGMAAFWMGVGSSYPSEASSVSNSCPSPSSANVSFIDAR